MFNVQFRGTNEISQWAGLPSMMLRKWKPIDRQSVLLLFTYHGRGWKGHKMTWKRGFFLVALLRRVWLGHV